MAEPLSHESYSRKSNISCAHDEYNPHICPSNFSYKPLEDPARWIRLLTLYPAIDKDAPLQARLWPVHRDEAPEFTPVSYTWGEEGTTSNLWVDDLDAAEPSTVVSRCIPIRPNLEKLLRQVRSREAVPIIWVDAICINQEDSHEKGFQVRHMDEIYRDRQVWIWLGERSENSDVAIDFVEEWTSLVIQSEGKCDGASKDLTRSESTSPKWSALWDLIGRPWFSRRWIVQECVLSNRKHLMVDDRHLSWEALISLVLEMQARASHDEGNVCGPLSFLEDRQGHEGVHGLLPIPDRIGSLICLNNAYMAFRRGEESHLTLEKLVDDFCGFFSQDPRDGIYAFISMASDTKGHEWIPDYSQENSHIEVYAQATRHIIRQTKSLDIICRSVVHFSRPSWIPWFGPAEMKMEDGHTHTVYGYNKKSLTTFGQPLRAATNRLRLGWIAQCDGCGAEIQGVRYNCGDCENFDFCDTCVKGASTSHAPGHAFREILQRRNVYDASYGRSVDLLPESEWIGVPLGRRLTIRAAGWFADTVSQIETGILMKRVMGATSIVIDLENKPRQDVEESNGLSDGFLRAITGNRRLEKVNSANPNHGTEFVISHVTDSWIQSVGDWIHVRPWLQSTRTTFVTEREINHQIMASLAVMASGGRKYARTDRSIGFVPSGTVPGDAIWILHGCTVPLVLRKIQGCNEHQWVLVGECYVEGLMEGEFMEVEGTSLKRAVVELV